MKRVAVYAGTFDPLTNGHLWMIKEGSELFDELIVAIGINPEKKTTFSIEQRLKMLRKSTKSLSNVKTETFPFKLLVEHAKEIGAQYIIRGIRNESDYTYERTMRNLNGDFEPQIKSVFLMPPREMAEISSSVVRGLVGVEGWEKIVKRYVPEPVFKKLKEKYSE